MATTTKAAEAAVKNVWEIMVPVFLPKIPGDESQVFVGVNGQSFLIPRGKRFEVPKPVADVLMASDEAKSVADEYAAAEREKMNHIFGAP